jgi:hypothetical protein
VSGIVIDASITLSWCFPDEQTELSIKILESIESWRPGPRAGVLVRRGPQHLLVERRGGASRQSKHRHFSATFAPSTRPLITPHWRRFADWFKRSAAIIGSRHTMRCTSNSPLGWVRASHFGSTTKGGCALVGRGMLVKSGKSDRTIRAGRCRRTLTGRGCFEKLWRCSKGWSAP